MATSSRAGRFLRRFLVPRIFASLYYLVRNGSKVSHRAEVDFSPNLKLGPRSTISSFAKVKVGRGEFITGKECEIGPGSFVSAQEGGIHVGDYFATGPNVTIVSGGYEFARLDLPFREQRAPSKGVRIGNNVSLGAGTVVIDGVHLGDNTMVMANSLVTRRFPPNCILQGNPAKILLNRNPAAGRKEESQ